MKSHSKRILSLVFALLMLFQQVMFAAQTVDLFNPELGAKTVDLIPGEDDTNTVDLLTPSEEDSTKTVDLLNPEQPSATIEQQKPIIEKNENKTVDTITPRGDDIVPAEGKKSTTTIVVGGDEIEEGETNENSEISPEEIILPEENEKEEKKDASFEDEEHHENAGVLPWSTDLVKPWSIYRAPKTVYRPGEDLDLTELLVEIKTGRSGSLYNIEDLINDEFTTITRTRKSDGQKVRLDDKIYEDETMTIHMDGCQDLTIDFTVDENLKDEAKAFEAFQQNLIREEFRNGLDFSLYLIKKGEKENPVVAYSLDPHKLTPIGNGVDKKLKDGPLFDLKDINTWDRYDIETIGKVKAILERSAEIKDTENIRKKLITQLAIWNVTSNIIPEEIDATVSEPTEIAPELKPADETKENPEEDKKDEPIEITEPTTPEEETENIEKENEKVEDTKDETVEIKTEEKVEEKAETEENKESEKIEEKAPVQSTVRKIVFNAKEIDVPYDDIELSDEEYELYKELTSLEAVELKNEDEDLKIYEPIIIEETENQYADLVTIGESDIDSIERVATEVTFDAVEYSFQNLYHTLETSSMLGFGQPRDFNVLLKATMKASRKIVEGDKFEVEILSKTLPILNGEEGRANDIRIDGKVVATAEYIAEEHKIVYTFVEDLDTDKVEIEQEFKQIKEEKAALLNMLEVSENLVLDAVRGAEGAENSEENPDELEISPEDDNATIKLVLGKTPVQYSGNPFANKKFHLKTQMTAKAVPFWKIPEGWTFDVNIGPYLKPDPDNPLKPLYDPNNPSDEVATPFYNELRHVITYTFTKDLNETKTLDIDQYLAFDTKSIGYRKEININITVSPKNYPVQSMPTITVKGDDPRYVIESKFVVQDNTQSDKVEYPYMVSYVSKQSVKDDEVTWDIDVDTTPLKKEKLDYNNIALSLYIPQNQGLSDYRVFVDNKEGTFNANGDIVLSNTTISKNSIPDTLKIKVQAKASVERDAYSLGIRITPDKGYIKELRKELETKKESLNSVFGPLFTVISYLKDLNYSTKFDNGFNLLDTRITATGVPENGNERAEGYNDPLRTFYSYKTNDAKNPIGFKLSETIDLRNIKSEIGSDVYSINTDSLFNFKLKDQNPNVNIYVPINNGTYKQITLGNVNKAAFDDKISNLKSNNELLPGTIIEYDFVGQPINDKTEFSMSVKLNERELFIEQFNAYKTIASEGVAKFININGSKNYDKYKIGIYKNKKDSIKSMIFKVIDTGENGYCINPGRVNPTEERHFHKKVSIDENKGLNELYEALKPNGNISSNNDELVRFVKKLKKIFYYYDKYERENKLDIINNEYTKYQIRDARQAAIFDLVNGTGRTYLYNGYYGANSLHVIDGETINYYNILSKYINNSNNDLDEEQLKRVKITLYPVSVPNLKYQNIITGEVDNPVSIAKVNEKGEPLSGATFQIIKNGVQIDSWISNGQAHEIYLEPGEYILREIKAPDGYKEIENVHFSVVKNVTINNIKVARKDVGNGPDEIFDSQEKYYRNIINIDSLNSAKNINVLGNGGLLEVTNKKVENSISIKKVDSEDHSKTLSGAEFTLYRIIDGKQEYVDSKITNGDGIAKFFGLDKGEYILVETKTPPQYSKIEESIRIKVDDNGVTTPGYTNPIDNSGSKKYIYKPGEVNSNTTSNGALNHKAEIISLKNNTMVTRIYLNPLGNYKPENQIKQDSFVQLDTGGKIESVRVYRVVSDDRDKYFVQGINPELNLVDICKYNKNSQTSILFNPTTKEINFSKDTTRKIYSGTSGIDTPFSGNAGVIIDVVTKFTGINGGALGYTWTLYKNPKSTLSVSGKSTFTCEEDKGDDSPETLNIVVANKKSSNKLIIRKVDKTSKPLELAEFGLYRESDKERVKVATSGIDGKAVFTDIEPGVYFVQEITAPSGYKKIDSKIKVTVGGDKSIIATNEDGNSLITIDKVPEEEKVVPVQIDRIVDHHTWHNFINWRSELKSVDFNKNIVTTRLFLNPATDERGNGPDKQTSLTLESLQQNNKIKEIKVYKLSNYEKDGVHAETDLSNLLVNAENNSLYKSINYDPTNESTKATLTFGSKGENDRWYGASYVIDITSGFDKNSKTNVIKANWKSDGANETTHLEAELGFKIVDQLAQATVVNNKNTNFKIQKVDADDENKRLEGAEFTLYEFTSNEGTEPKVVKKVVTVKDGIAEFNDVKIGKYILKETNAPEGYSKINAELIVEIGEDGKVNFSNIDDYKDIFSKTTTITKKEARLTINRVDHNQALIQTHPYTKFMNLTAKVINADEKSMTSRIYLNPLNTNEGFGPNRLTELQLSSLNSTGIKSTVYKVPLANKSSIEEIDKYIQSKNPIANDLRDDSSNSLIKFNSAGDNRWYGSAYVVDVETTYKAIDPNADATETLTRTLNYFWYNIDDNDSYIRKEVSSDVSVTKKLEDIKYEETCVLKVKNKKSGTKVTVVKVDEADTNHKIPGAKFEIFYEGENTPIKQKDGNDFVITGDDGKATFEDLEPGKTYIINEKEAPDGYEKTGNIWIVTVSKDKKVTVIEREIDNSGQEFAAINKNEASKISYGGRELLKVHPTISINTDGTYTAKLILNRLDTKDNGQIDIFFDNKNFVFYDDTIRAKDGWKYINLSKANVNNVFEFKFSPKASLNDETYFPIARIAYMGVKLDEKFLPSLNKLIRDGSVSNKDKGKYIIVQPNNFYRIWDNDQYRNDLVLVKTEISKIKDSDSFYLDIVMDRKYNGYFRLDNEVIFDTSLFDIYTDKEGYGLDTTGKAKFWIDCDKIHSQDSIVRYIITPKEGISGKLQPIKSLKFGNASISESDNDGRYMAYILARKEQKVEVVNSGNEFSFNATNRFKGYNVQFEKYELLNNNVHKISDVEFKLQVKDGTEYRDLTVEEKQLVNDISKSDINGIVEFKGLRPGKYSLIETKAPAVYRIPKDPVKYFEITEEGKIIIYRLDKNNNLVEDTSNQKLMIKNDRVGDGEFELIKYDPNEPDPNNPKNKKPLEGVEFELYKSNGEKYGETVKTDKEGKISFKNLPFDRYTLREIKTLPGYILDPEEKTILIGEQWDVPKDVNGHYIKGSDVSRFLELNKDASRIESSSGTDTVKPNKGELVSVNLKYNILSEDGIKPGDTFTLVTSKNVDLDSISRVPDYKYDIYGPAGRLAAAKIGEDRKSITYTFTEYLESATLTDLNIGMLLAVDRFTVKKNGEIDVAIDFKDSGNTVNEFNKKINVDYTYSKYYDLNGCLVKYIEGSNKTPQVKDTFRVIYYIKNHRFAQVDSYSKNLEIYSDDVDFTINKVKAYKVKTGYETIPWSFGLDLKEGKNDNQYGLNWVGNYFAKDPRDNKKYLINLNPDDLDKSEYVVEVIGTVDNLHDNPFTLKCRYNRVYRQYDVYNNYYDTPIYEIATVYKKKKEASSSAATTFKLDVPNYKNKIEYTKVDGTISGTAVETKPQGLTPQGSTEGVNEPIKVPKAVFSSVVENPLKGAIFVLKKDQSNVALKGSERETGDNGKFSWEGLLKGKYEVWEIKAPDGYKTPEKPVSSFEVNDDGEIINIKDNTTIIKNYKNPEIEFQKVDGENKSVKLKGAKFTLYMAEKHYISKEYIKKDGNLQFAMVDRDFNIVKEYDSRRNLLPDNPDKGYTVESSNEEGTFKFEKLKDGIYAVKETTAPSGYTKLLDYALIFKVDGGKIYEVNKAGNYVDKNKKVTDIAQANLLVDVESGKAEVKPIQIENFKVEYPATGGVGTLPFVFIGMMIMMAGAYMFIRRRDALYE